MVLKFTPVLKFNSILTTLEHTGHHCFDFKSICTLFLTLFFAVCGLIVTVELSVSLLINPISTVRRWGGILTFQLLAYLSNSLCLPPASACCPQGAALLTKKAFFQIVTVLQISYECGICVAITFPCILPVV